MRATTPEELVQLPEALALQRHFDDKNYRVFRFLLFVALCCGLIGFGVSIDLKRPSALVVFFLDLLLCGVLFALRRDRIFERTFRQIFLAFVVLQVVILKYALLDARGESALGPFFMLMFLTFAFRLRVAEHLLVAAAIWMAAIVPSQWLGAEKTAALPTDAFLPLTVVSGLVCGATLFITHLERRKFLRTWHREFSRHRERQRLRDEIDTARKIQLSMLPQRAPAADWLDLAAASIPAAEVGGDYYDYFQLDDDRVVLVVGDVAGHGVASGLLLSGVRSCLYLLEQDLGEPEGVFARLDHMVRRTTDRRTYVTLLCAILDRAAGTLSVINAGHPPVLRHSEEPSPGTGGRWGKGLEIGRGSPPLGTRLQARYELERTPLRSGDLLLLYSDGIIEARNAAGQDYGIDRLSRVVQRASRASTVRDVRDSILADFSHFRGDEEQADDLTLVVARIR